MLAMELPRYVHCTCTAGLAQLTCPYAGGAHSATTPTWCASLSDTPFVTHDQIGDLVAKAHPHMIMWLPIWHCLDGAHNFLTL